MEFIIDENLKNRDEKKASIKLKVPVDFFKLSDEKYLSEVESSIRMILNEGADKSLMYRQGKITKEAFYQAREIKRLKMTPYLYVYNYILQIRRGSDFSLRKDNKLVLFLGRVKPIDGSYEFHPNHLFSLGKGTFVDEL